MEIAWQISHKRAMADFLAYLNKQTASFILKGGTALSRCYNHDRFSEDIYFDAQEECILPYVQGFCNKYSFSYRIIKETAMFKRYLIDYGQKEKSLKIEVSYRNKLISATDICTVNGITVYSIDRLAQMKSNAYNAMDRLQDLFDLAFIVNNYYHELSGTTLNVISDMLQYKGLEHLDYLLATKQDELVNPEKLLENFLAMYNRLNIIYSENDEAIFRDYVRQKGSPPAITKTVIT